MEVNIVLYSRVSLLIYKIEVCVLPVLFGRLVPVIEVSEGVMFHQ